MIEPTFKAVDAKNWVDLERLFEGRGGPHYCWCMLWRLSSVQAKQMDGACRKAALLARVRAGEPVGLLGYAESQPVAWCSIAPRSTYRRLGGDDGAGETVWSIACFFVVRRLRGEGLAQKLLAEAVRYAQAQGANVVEAYPVDPDSPSYRFMGFVPMFEAAGFREVRREGLRRHVMRLRVPDSR
jgi:GNAT superfamily N-acetyltransferase